MNNKQKLFSAITGYEVNKSYSSSREEYYNKLSTKEEKLKYLDDYGFNALDEGFTTEELEETYKALEKFYNEDRTSNKTYQIYDSLNN